MNFNVRSYIQNGSVIFECENSSKKQLENSISDSIGKEFGIDITVMNLDK